MEEEAVERLVDVAIGAAFVFVNVLLALWGRR